VHQQVYEITGLEDGPIDGRFYNYEPANVIVSPETDFEIFKIVHTHNNDSIKQHFVKWRGYDETVNTCVNAIDMKEIYWIIFM